MALLWIVVSCAFSLMLTPFLMLLLAIIFLASIGKSLGVRRLYIKLLLALFEVSLRINVSLSNLRDQPAHSQSTSRYYNANRVSHDVEIYCCHSTLRIKLSFLMSRRKKIFCILRFKICALENAY
jgi:hypothetical protein